MINIMGLGSRHAARPNMPVAMNNTEASKYNDVCSIDATILQEIQTMPSRFQTKRTLTDVFPMNDRKNKRVASNG